MASIGIPYLPFSACPSGCISWQLASLLIVQKSSHDVMSPCSIAKISCTFINEISFDLVEFPAS